MKKYIINNNGLSILSGLLLATAAAAQPALAGENIPVSVTVTGIKADAGPVYISIQGSDDYMRNAGHGAIIPAGAAGSSATTINIDSAGDYAVSAWHDINSDGQFNRDEYGRPLDGWGASGNPPTDRVPAFDEVKISVPSNGVSVSIDLVYPDY